VHALRHLGVTHIDIPITPEKVWQVLKAKGAALAPLLGHVGIPEQRARRSIDVEQPPIEPLGNDVPDRSDLLPGLFHDSLPFRGHASAPGG
jgi:hypothetical protein